MYAIAHSLHGPRGDGRGTPFAVTRPRLAPICAGTGGGPGEQRPARIGLSATIKPIEDAARFLVGADRVTTVEETAPVSARPEALVGRVGQPCHAQASPDCAIVNTGHQRDLEIQIEIPPTDL